MKKICKSILSFALAISMVFGLLPLDLMDFSSYQVYAAPVAKEVKTPEEFEHFLEDASALSENGKTKDEDGWQYVILPDYNYAIITGYIGNVSSSMVMPEILGGADVVGVISEALNTLKGIRDIVIPSNVLTMGAKALPVGVTLKSTSGSYAQNWAKRNNYAFTSTSEYSFVQGVVDFAGIREENFNRIDSSEIWLRDLEAMRLEEGTVFFLLDPSDIYQVSYYQVTSMEKGIGGFTIVHCETPELDTVFLEYESVGETLMVDLSSVQLAEGATMDLEDSQNRYFDENFSYELGPKFTFKKKLGDHASIKGSADALYSYKGNVHVGLLTEDNVTIVETQKVDISATLTTKTDLADEDGDFAKKLSSLEDNVMHGSKKLGVVGQGDIDLPLASAMVVSVAGIVNVSVNLRVVIEFSGEIKITYTYSTTNTYTYKEGKDFEKSSKKGVSKFSGSAEGTFKAGIEASLEIYLGFVKVVTVSLFAGLQAEITYDFGEALNTVLNAVGTLVGIKEFLLSDSVNVNMLDCFQIQCHFVVEVSATLGVGDWLTLASAKTTLIDWHFADFHYHYLPFAYKQTTVKDSDKDVFSYLYQLDTSSIKSILHRTEDCPYETHNVKFVLPADKDRILKKLDSLLLGTKVEKQNFPEIELDHLKLLSWHTDKGMDDSSAVKDSDWPYEINTDVTFYAKTVPMHEVQLIGADGINMNLGTIQVQDKTLNDKRNIDFSDGYDWVAENEEFILPKQNAAGDTITLWIPVASEDNLELIGTELNAGKTYKVEESSSEKIVLCALTNKDIEAKFFDGIHNDPVSVIFVRRGDKIKLPAGPENLITYKFDGWMDENDNLITEDYQTDWETPSLLIFTANLVPGDFSGAIPMDNATIGSTVPRIGAETSDEEIFYWEDNEDGTCTVTGLNTDTELSTIYVSIPRTLGGLIVTRIAPYAFYGNNTLRSVRMPATVKELGYQAFEGCGSLVLIDMSLSQITEIPSEFAYDCESLVSVLYPSGNQVAIGDNAFTNCRSIASVRLDGPIGYNAFGGCTRISSVTMGNCTTKIGAYAFSGCTKLSSVDMGNRVMEIGSYAFSECPRLTSLSIPVSINSIGNGIIEGCSILTNLEVNACINEISDGMFYVGETSALTSLNIGGGVKHLRYRCFANGDYGFETLTSLTISGYVSIEASAFGNSSITDLTLNGGSIDSYAFSNLNTLERVTINDGVSKIGHEAFAGCESLTSVTIGKNVKYIYSRAFSNCTALREVTFKNTQLKLISDNVFENCTSLTDFVMPETVTEYGEYIFYGCSSLKTLSVGKGVSKANSNSFTIGSDNTLNKLIVREGTLSIPESAFSNNAYYFDDYDSGFTCLREIVLPSTLCSIGEYAFMMAGVRTLTVNSPVNLGSNAFYGCRNLTELHYNAGTISDYAFYNCETLERVVIGTGVKSLGYGAFENCTGLREISIENGVRKIGDNAFKNCSSLTSLTLPESVSEIGYEIIWGCTALQTLSLGSIVSKDVETINYSYHNWHSPLSIGEGSNLKNIIIREGVTKIGYYEFFCGNDDSCFSSVISVEFPSTLRYIGDRAFNRTNIQEITLKSNVYIGDWAFGDNPSLKKVSMNGGSIGYAAFAECTGMEAFRMGNVSSIEDAAFSNCKSLKSLTIPDSVYRFGEDVLYGCNGLEYLSIGEAAEGIRIGSMLKNNGVSALKELVLRDGITRAYSEDFKDMKQLTTVSLPSTLQEIGYGAFEDTSVQRITLDGDVNIDSNAFKNCRQLTEFNMTSGSVSTSAFEGCISLRSFRMAVGTGEIGSSAFKDCYHLESVKLGEGVTSIGYEAFYGCSSLKSLAIPDSVTYLGENMIRDCLELKDLYIGGGSEDLLYNYYWYWYYGCPFTIGEGAQLESITIGEGVKYLPPNVFANYDRETSIMYGFPNLKTVVIPESVESISENAFYGSAIREINLKGTVELGYQALNGMQKLERVSIPAGTIGNRALAGDTALCSIEIGSMVTSIGDEAFAGCTSLTGLYIPDSVTYYGCDMIFGCENLTDLSVGKGLNRNSWHSDIFRIGQKNSLKRLDIRDGVTRIEDYAFANRVDDVIYGFNKLTSVSIPESLSYLGNGNISNWPSIQHLYFRYGSLLLDYEGDVPEGLTIYTDYYNARVEDYCLDHNLNYLIRGEDALPIFALRMMVPVGTTVAESNTVINGFALYQENELEYTEDIEISEPEVKDGYFFYGWYSDPEYRNIWKAETMPAEDVTLYARIEKGITVTYKLGIGNGFSDYVSYSVKRGGKIPVPEDPSAGGYAFYGWYSEPSLTVPARMEKAPSHDMVVYGKMSRISAGGQYRNVNGGLQLVSYKLQAGESVDVSIPAKINGVPVVSIAEGAFDHSGIRILRLPSSVTDITEGAFKDDSGMLVLISEGNTAYVSENRLVYNADKSLLLYRAKQNGGNSISIPSTVRRIAAYAFMNNTDLHSVYFEDGLEEIGAYAFSGCTGINNIKLPDSVTTIRRNAFEYCWRLEYFKAMGLTTFENKVGNSYVETLPKNLALKVFGPVGEGVLRDAFTFRDSRGTEYTTQYNQYTLYLIVNGRSETMACEAGQTLEHLLSDTVLEDGTVIHGWYRDYDLTETWNLSNDRMPENNLYLYASASSLFEYGCDYVESDYVGNYGAILKKWNGTGSYLDIPERLDGYDVCALADGFLSSKEGVSTIVIPSSVIYIDENALICADGDFTGTIIAEEGTYAYEWALEHGLTGEKPLHKITFVTNGETLTDIEASAGTRLYLPVPERAGRTFRMWSYYPDNEWYEVELEDDLYTMPQSDIVLYAIWEGEDEQVDFTWTAKNRKVTITGYTGSSMQVVIPENINGWPVTVIAESAFEGCDFIRSCEIPSTVVSIGGRAFAGTSLTDVVIGDQVTELGKEAFADCTSLYRITLGAQVQNLSADDFDGDNRLHEVWVSENNKTYSSKDGVLYSADGKVLIYYPPNRSELTYTVPNGTETIGTYAFHNNKVLTAVDLPESAVSVEKYAFAGCSALERFTGEGLREIGDSAFFDCNALESVILGEELKQLGDFAFGSNRNLKEIQLFNNLTLDPNRTYFDETSGLTIFGSYGSSVFEYADENDIRFVDPNVASITEILLSDTELEMEFGTIATLTASSVPEDALYGADLTWYSSDTDVVRVNDGVLYAVGNGKATITALAGNGCKATCSVTVRTILHSLTLSAIPSLKVGESVQMTINTDPANIKIDGLYWNSGDSEIAEVDEKGLVTAIGLGTTVISVENEDGVRGEQKITVYEPIDMMEIMAPDQTLYAIEGSNQLQLTLNIEPENATYKEVRWSTNDGSLRVDENGLVTARSAGTYVVYADATGPDPKHAEYEITVELLDISNGMIRGTMESEFDNNYVYPDFQLNVDGMDISSEYYRCYWEDYTPYNAGEYSFTLDGDGYRTTGEVYGTYTILKKDPEMRFVESDQLNIYSIENEDFYEYGDYYDLDITYQYKQEDGTYEYVSTPEEDGVYLITINVTENNTNYNPASFEKEFMILCKDRIETYDQIILPAEYSVTLPIYTRSVYGDSLYLDYSVTDSDIAYVNYYGGISTYRNGSTILEISGGNASVECEITVKEIENHLILPEELTEIEEEAFAGSPMIEMVTLPRELTMIGSAAFADMSGLLWVEFPDKEMYIAEDAFEGSNPVFICIYGSTAENYAKEHGFQFVYRY